MDNFKFTKSMINNNQATTQSNFVKIGDIDRIQKIHDNMDSMFHNKKPLKPIKTVQQNNTDIFKSRINALNNIKKD